MPHRTNIFAIATMATAVACATTPACALAAKTSESARIEAGVIVDAPRGFVEMCTRDLAACTPATLQAIGTASSENIVTGAIHPHAMQASMIYRQVTLPSALPLPDIKISLPVNFPASFEDADHLPAEPTLETTVSTQERPPLPVASSLSAGYDLLAFSSQTALLPAPLAIINPSAPAVTFSTKVSAPVEREMTPTAMRHLVSRINSDVNRRTLQIADSARFGVDERWQRARVEEGSAGDCEDIALEKRAELIDAGVAPNRLLLAIVYAREVGLHTVLVVRMPDRDVVLDSLRSGVQSRGSLNYSWISIQSPDDPMTWRRVV